MEQKDKFVIGGEEYLNLRQLAEREGFTKEGMTYRVKKLGIGVKFDFTNRVFFPLKEVEQLEKEGKFVRLK